MSKALNLYRHKRNFGITSESQGTAAQPGRALQARSALQNKKKLAPLQIDAPMFHGLRSDKPARSIIQDVAMRHHSPSTTASTRTRRTGAEQAAPAKKLTNNKTASKKMGALRTTRSPKDSAIVAGITISHPDRIIDPVSQFTKLQLAQFYESIAAHILPHLDDRSVSLVRAPEGVDGELFFQKHGDTLQIPHIRELDPQLLPGHPPLLEIDSLAALIGAVQMNTIEFHTWNAKVGLNKKLRRIETPDRMTFDLDPGAGFTWPQMLQATHLAKTLLDELGLRSFLKTSGGKGLHIVVPLAPQLDWDTVKDFSAAVTQHLARTVPQLFVAKSGPKNRVGKVFVDYLRNGRGATTATAFSVRARPGLGVSVPVAWDELDELSGGAHWTVATLPRRLQRLCDDPWAGYNRSRQTLRRAMHRLGFEAAR